MSQPANHERAPTKRRAVASIELQPRDLALFDLFTRFRVATLADLFPLLREHFPTPFVLWRRARRLTATGYLTQPPEQQLRLYKKRGNPAHVYALGNAAAKELRARGVELPKIDFDQKTKALKAYSLEHPLMIARVLSSLLQGLRALPHLRLVHLFPDGDYVDAVVVPVGSKRISLPIRPDVTLSIHDTTTDERLALFVEIDRGTEPKKREKLIQSSFYKKVLAYLAYFREPERFIEALDASDFVVLTVADSSARLERLRVLTKAADLEQRGTDLFWFTAAESFTGDDPTRALTAPVWTTAAESEGSLF